MTAWVLYDFAYVIFSINILSLYFPLWVVDEAGGSESGFAIATGISMAIVFVLAPILGGVVDLMPRRVPALAVLTVACCSVTFLLGSGSLTLSLVCFVLAGALFQLCIVIYDSLLSVVSTERTRGTVSGYGFAAGFGGSLVGIGLGMTVLAFDDTAKPTIFRLTALGFLLFAVPCFLWVREPQRTHMPDINRDAVIDSIRSLRSTTQGVRQHPGLGRFLLGRIFYSDAINTLMIFMSIYATREIGFSEFETQLVLLAGILAGPLGALGGGRSVDRRGPKWTLAVMLSIWCVALTASAAIPLLGLPKWLFWIVAPVVGIGLGGTSTTERAYLFRLAPPGQVGRYLGLYMLVGRFAAFMSPLLWVLIADVLGLGRPVAVLFLLLLILIGRRIVSSIDDSPRQWDDAHEEIESTAAVPARA